MLSRSQATVSGQVANLSFAACREIPTFDTRPEVPAYSLPCAECDQTYASHAGGAAASAALTAALYRPYVTRQPYRVTSACGGVALPRGGVPQRTLLTALSEITIISINFIEKVL